MYNYFVKKLLRKSFGLVNNHSYAELCKSLAPDVKHSFAGNHALGGIRHDRVILMTWFERLGRIMPKLKITVNNITVKGWPNNTLVIARWTGTAVLENGDPYLNKGAHFITIKWGKITEFDVYEDSQAVFNGLEKQFQSGIEEARASPITS